MIKMKKRLKNWLFQSNNFLLQKTYRVITPVCFLFLGIYCKSQNIINYVNNGGFEDTIPGFSTNFFNTSRHWNTIDTGKFGYFIFSTFPNISSAPYCSTGFQYPRHGNNFMLGQFYCSGSLCTIDTERGYPRNRLKGRLIAGKTYCGKYYVVNTNNNRVAIGNYGMYIGGEDMDTITYCNHELTYLIPQIENSTGIIIDTLNWIPITGTFVANGSEKYLVLGNFRSNISTPTLQLNSVLSTQTTDAYIDDVSLIEYELPAYAYQSPDAYILPGDSVYLGRERDVGIDEACLWYELPNTTTAIDTAAGIWVKPTQTTSYLVKQDICGNIKWALVTVNISDVGVNELGLIKNDFKLYPNPASNEITIAFNNEADFTKPKELKIIDVLGREVKTILIEIKTQKVNIEELSNGVYYLQLQTPSGVKVIKKLVKE
jgi:hypothetical protein